MNQHNIPAPSSRDIFSSDRGANLPQASFLGFPENFIDELTLRFYARIIMPYTARKEDPIMKKAFSLFLALVMCLSLCACGGQKGEVGTTYTSNGVEFTVNYIEFTDAIDNWGGANDNYWMPLPADANRNQLANARSPKSADDTICVISYTAKNVSKGDKLIDDRGVLNYDNGYKYDDGGLTYRVSATGVWSDLDGGLMLKQLKENAYEFRVYMVVPKALVENTDKSLTYTLFGVQFDLR